MFTEQRDLFLKKAKSDFEILSIMIENKKQ